LCSTARCGSSGGSKAKDAAKESAEEDRLEVMARYYRFDSGLRFPCKGWTLFS
jgi:hypothetical protein